MKILILVALLGFAFAKVDYTGHQVYRIHPLGYQNEVVKQLNDQYELDFWSEARFDGDFVDFRVPPNLKPEIDVLLARNRISVEIFIEDLQIAIDAEKTTKPHETSQRASSIQLDQYHTYDEINAWITSFAADNSIVEAVDVGVSYEGRQIQALKISTGAGHDSSFVINCGIHAREWVSPATCIWTANELVTQYAGSPILDNLDIYIIPTSNPDGYVYTQTDRMWRKTRSPRTNDNCPSNQGKLCYGVDPNRNFDVAWSSDDNTGSSPNCCSDSYHGPSAFSEPETAAQRDFVFGLGNVKAYIDIHAYSQYWMFPYGYKETLPQNYQDLLTIGKDSVNAIYAVHGQVYVTGTIANVIYVATGSSADFFYDNGIKCTFAAELRDTGTFGFTLPPRFIIPTAEETFAGLGVIAEAVVAGICG